MSAKRSVLALVCAALIIFFSLYFASVLSGTTDLNISSLPVKTIIYFYFFVALIYTLSIGLWHGFSSTSDLVEKRTLREAILDTGLIAIGKYIPGKLWGILARGAVTNGSIVISKSSVAVSMFEQIYALVTGFFLIAALLLFQTFSLKSVWFSLPALALIIWSPTLLANYQRRWPALSTIPCIRPPIAAYLVVGHLTLWTLCTVPVLILMNTTHTLNLIQMINVSTAFISAVLAGWISLFAPGGIGIREAAFAAAAPEWLSWQQGLFWIALHRALYTIFDVVYGTIALIVLACDIRGSHSNA